MTRVIPDLNMKRDQLGINKNKDNKLVVAKAFVWDSQRKKAGDKWKRRSVIRDKFISTNKIDARKSADNKTLTAIFPNKNLQIFNKQKEIKENFFLLKNKNNSVCEENLSDFEILESVSVNANKYNKKYLRDRNATTCLGFNILNLRSVDRGAASTLKIKNNRQSQNVSHSKNMPR